MRPTPWNTYVRSTALPATPIANPGRAAIAGGAAIPSPAKIFISSPTGPAATSSPVTLADHNRNVARLRQVERDRANPR